ncbi:MAG: hypothetical protein M2R45_03316 [Verrucomicrobia subdivision 3 bacterium]|nr:hypothetical protein [Limisphaerales bacterium]MCS1415406.1 hypothetical protein [Limisphaerales bacterium]
MLKIRTIPLASARFSWKTAQSALPAVTHPLKKAAEGALLFLGKTTGIGALTAGMLLFGIHVGVQDIQVQGDTAYLDCHKQYFKKLEHIARWVKLRTNWAESAADRFIESIEISIELKEMKIESHMDRIRILAYWTLKGPYGNPDLDTWPWHDEMDRLQEEIKEIKIAVQRENRQKTGGSWTLIWKSWPKHAGRGLEEISGLPKARAAGLCSSAERAEDSPCPDNPNENRNLKMKRSHFSPRTDRARLTPLARLLILEDVERQAGGRNRRPRRSRRNFRLRAVAPRSGFESTCGPLRKRQPSPGLSLFGHCMMSTAREATPEKRFWSRSIAIPLDKINKQMLAKYNALSPEAKAQEDLSDMPS